MNTIELTFNKIVLSLPDPSDWIVAKRLTGKIEEKSPGIYEMALSTHNLSRIAHYFTGDRKPIVTKGRQFLDSLTNRLREYKIYREGVKNVLEKEMYPVEPNGKFIPYRHQTKIIGVINKNPYSTIASDCGTGKTGSSARAVEIELDKGTITRGKVLVTAPLSILDTSWRADVHKFTSLRTALLWTPKTNRNILGEEKVLLQTFEEKPADTVTVKRKTGTRFRMGSTGEVKEKVTLLDGTGWTKYQASWKVAINLLGEETPFGEVWGKTSEKEKTRENYIKAQLERKDVDIFLINHDGVRIYESVLKENNFEWIIVDESTKIKNSTSAVFRAHVNISWKAKRRNTLSGTPNPNGFIDLWAQYYFLDRGLTFEPCLKDFLKEYFEPEIIGYTKTPGGKKAAIKYNIRNQEAKDRLIERARSVGIFIEQRDCIDLPPRTDMTRVVYMTPEQEQAYIRMETSLVAELRNVSTDHSVEAEATNVLSKIMKLRQITSGFLMNDRDVVCVANNPKWQDLDDLIEELGSKKLVVVCQFREEINQLLSRYKHHGAKGIFGDVSVDDRNKAINNFQSDTETRLVVVQPKAGGHGITLTTAAHLYFTSLDYNYELFYQVAKRIERIGQKNPMFVISCVARFSDGDSTIDEDLLDILGVKANDRNSLFESNKIDKKDVAKKLIARIINRNERK